MLTLVFDTETTGLPPRGNKSLTKMPYIIQLAAVLFKDQRPVGHLSCMVDPTTPMGRGVIPQEKFWVDNKLTTSDISDCWLPTELAFKMFDQYLRLADRTVAHNSKFDEARIEDTFERLGVSSVHWEDTPKFCTMNSLTNHLKIPGPSWSNDYKWPNLEEAYRALVDPYGFEDAHDAMADVQACAKVLFAIEDLGLPLLSASK